MKTILRSFFVNGLALWWSSLLVPGLLIEAKVLTMVLAAVALTVLNKTVKPLIKLFLLPINLLTLGLFGWVSNVITLFIITKVISGVRIAAFSFPGWEYSGFIVPSISFSVIAVYIVASIVISLLAAGVRWLFAK